MPTIRDILSEAQGPATGPTTIRDVLDEARRPAGMPAVATESPAGTAPGFGRRLLATGVRVVPPLAAGIATANPLVAAGVGAGSEALAQFIEGQGFSPGQMALQGGLSLIPGLKIGEEVGPIARTALRAGEGALLGGGAGAASRLIGGERTTVHDVLRDALLGTAFGAGGGALEARGVRGLTASRKAGAAAETVSRETPSRAKLYTPEPDRPAFFTRVPGTDYANAPLRPAIRTADGRIVTGYDHGDALNRARDAGHSVGDLGQAAGWRVGDQFVADTEIGTGDPEREVRRIAAARATPPPAGPMPEERILQEKMRMVFGPEQGDAMHAIAQRHAPEIEAQSRGQQSDARTDALAGELHVALGKRTAAGTAFNAEELRAVSSTLRGLLEREKALAETHARAPTDATAAELSQVNKELAVLTSNFMAGRAEAGRALRILRFEADVRAEPRQRATERLLGMGVSPDQIAAVLAKTPNDPVELWKAVRALNRPRAKDLIQWYWAANILSGAPTYEHKGLAELMTTLTAPITTPFAALGQAFRPAAERTVTLGEIPHQLIGLHAGIMPGFKKALYLLLHGYSLDTVAQFEAGRPEVTLRDIGSVLSRGHLDLGEGAENPLITGVLNYPFRMLGALREFFRTVNFEMERHAGAYQMARQEAGHGGDVAAAMVRILHENPEALIDRARRVGERQVYHDQAGFFARALLTLKQKDKYGFSSIILPFVATPASIGRRGAQFTPYGFLKAAREADPRLRAQLQGEAIFGTLMLIPFVKLALSGDLVGAMPRDAGQRDRMFAEGVLPDSVRIGDHRVQIHQLGPLAFPASMVANAIQTWKELQGKQAAGQDVDVSTAIFEFVRKTGSSWLNQSFMQGLFSFVSALEDPQQFGRRFGTSLAQSAVPASGLLRSITGQIDPVLREPRSAGEAVRSVIPGLSTSVPPRLRGTGEEAQRVSPFVVPPVTSVTTDPVRDAMAAIGVEVAPPRRSTMAGPAGKRVPFAPDDDLAVRRVQGYAVRARAEALLRRPNFQRLPDALKRNALRKVVAAAHGDVSRIGRYLVSRGQPVSVETLMQMTETPLPANAP